MSKFLKITPLDPLFFRAPLPFTAGEQDWAPSNPLPLLGTLYGALRSMILSKRDFRVFVKGSGYDDIGSPERKGRLRLNLFALARENGNGLIPYFSVPSDLLGKYISGKLVDVKRAYPREFKEAIFSPSEISSFFYLKEDGYEPITDRLISAEALKRYLAGDSLGFADFVEKRLFFVEEPKIGIAREKKTKAAKEGRLYRVRHYRYKDEARLVAWVEGTEEDLNGIFTLGGERRTVISEETPDPFGDFEVTINSNRFLVYLVTPAIFEGGWKSKRVVDGLREKGVEVKLVAASIPGYRVVSGWDIQKNAPKVLYRAVPEGSVFVFEVLDGEVKSAVEAFHMKNISDVNPEEGYGFSLVGKI